MDLLCGAFSLSGRPLDSERLVAAGASLTASADRRLLIGQRRTICGRRGPTLQAAGSR